MALLALLPLFVSLCLCSVSCSFDNTTLAITCSGAGPMKNYDSNTIPFKQECLQAKSLIIQMNVTSVGDYSFKDCSKLTSVSLPNSLSSIGKYAFYGCKKLASIKLPNSITFIGNSGFSDCSSLTSVTLPNSLKSISDYVFYYCSGLTSITFPDSLTSIGDYGFNFCTSLKSITFPDSLTSIGEGAFSDCEELTSITFSDSFKYIGDLAFSDCSELTSITLPDSLTYLGEASFQDCMKLSSVLISDSSKLTSLGIAAFSSCNLTSFSFPPLVTIISEDLFSYNAYLSSVFFRSVSITRINDGAFSFCDSLTYFSIPPFVTYIGKYAFNYCQKLSIIHIPSGVSFIGQNAFDSIAFTNFTYFGIKSPCTVQPFGSNPVLPKLLKLPSTYADNHFCGLRLSDFSITSYDLDNSLSINNLYKIDKFNGECTLLASAFSGDNVPVNIIIYITSQDPFTSTDALIGFNFNNYYLDSSTLKNAYLSSQLSLSLFTIDFSFTCTEMTTGCWFPEESSHFILNSDTNTKFSFIVCHKCTIDLLETSEFTDLMVSIKDTSTFTFPYHSAASCHIDSFSLFIGNDAFSTNSINLSNYSGQYSWYIKYITSSHSPCSSQTLISSPHKICTLNSPTKPKKYSNNNIYCTSSSTSTKYYYFVDKTFNFNFKALSSPCSDFSLTSSSVVECSNDEGFSSSYIATNEERTVQVSRTLICKHYNKYQSSTLLKSYSYDTLSSTKVTHHFYFSKFSLGVPSSDSNSQTVKIPVETWGGNFISDAETFSLDKSYNKCNFQSNKIEYDNYRYITFNCSENTKLKISLSLSFGSLHQSSEYFDIYYNIINSDNSCVIIMPVINNFRLLSTKATWNATSWGSSCPNSNCYFILTQYTSNSSEDFTVQKNVTQTFVANGVKQVSIYAQCTYKGKMYKSDNVTAFNNNCNNIKPRISNITCPNCILYKNKYFAYRTNTIFKFKLFEKGINCDDYSDEIKFTFYDFENTFSNSQSQYSISVSLSFNDNYDPDDNSMNSLIIMNFPMTGALSSFYKCYVPELSGKPDIISDSSQIFIHKSKATLYNITFSSVNNLYSPCFDANSTYQLFYWTSNSIPRLDLLSSNNYKKKDLTAVGNITYTWNISSLPISVYFFQIIARNVLNEFTSGSIASLAICAEIGEASPPMLVSPFNGESFVTVKSLELKWNASNATRGLRCSASEELNIVIELEDEYTFNQFLGPQSSLQVIDRSYSRILIKGKLLRLSTRYFWRTSFYYTSDDNTLNILSSPVNTFTTVHKHCAYMNCNYGTCIDETATCKCLSGYHGEFCEHYGLTSLSIGIIVGVTCLVLFAFLAVSFFILRKKYFTFGLKIPDMSLFMFTMPKRINEDDDEPAKSNEYVLQVIRDDCTSEFTRSISLLECTPVTDSDSICRSLMYCFEKEEYGLKFLLKLIEYEVAHSDSTATLFRNNSYASKCFKVYGRMIGLPYLFQVVFPLLNKLFKEQQKESVEIHGIDHDESKFASNYELNITNEDNDIAYEAALEENALLIQVACESFFASLKKTMSFCPNEFKVICKTIETEVSQKFPEASVEVCLASFLFLRYFVAGITVPESFGILSERPDTLMRRRLILIAKVLSNMSTHVKFGDKEDYMVVMNDYLESKQYLLKTYYNNLLNNINTIDTSVSIPDKYYNASLITLSFAFAKQENGEWKKDPEEKFTEIH